MGSVVSKSISLAHSGVTVMATIRSVLISAASCSRLQPLAVA